MDRRIRILRFFLVTAGLAAGAGVTLAATQIYRFTHSAVPNDLKAAGQVVIRAIDARTSETTLTLAGLTPHKAYAAHYHALGPQTSADPCQTAGPVTLGFPPFTASSTGRATVRLTAPSATLAGNAGAYINVHLADDLKVVPLCAAIIRGRPAAAGPAVPKGATVVIGDNRFQPATLTVKVGTTVTWKHQGAAVHNVISLEPPALHSNDLEQGETYAYLFSKAGRYTYYCSYHAGMTGTIIVTD
ncbi:cupredoxin domain-containing protein [Deinococcus navajonensis]|uniref:Plastocyanin/azurin family copper-binding protein n=1 Tax=Deinococcus navajonensis TaxID=309884 RepID=A0ABV8XK44_9DEIO